MEARSSESRTGRSSDELLTVEAADPELLVGRALDVLFAHGDASEALFYRLGEGTADVLVARWMHRGTARGEAECHRFFAEPPVEMMRSIGSSSWIPSLIRPRELEEFVERSVLLDDRTWYESAFFREFMVPAGLRDQQRLLVTHRRRIVGWIGLFRADGAPSFGARERRHLRRFVAPLGVTLSTVARLDDLGSQAPGDLVVRPDGRVEFASAAAAPWLAFRGFADALSSRIRELDRGMLPTPIFVLDSVAEARAMRLDGAEGVRYLVSVRPLRPIGVPVTATLSPAEREIASLASAGAAVSLIATTRGTTPGTVRNQLKQIYRTLGVCSRLELARELEARG